MQCAIPMASSQTRNEISANERVIFLRQEIFRGVELRHLPSPHE
jgi:hypothetical protein